MKIYCINYQHGEYDDYTDEFVGGWSSEEKRKIALDKLRTLRYNESARYKNSFPSLNLGSDDSLCYPEDDGELVCWEFDVDENWWDEKSVEPEQTTGDIWENVYTT